MRSHLAEHIFDGGNSAEPVDSRLLRRHTMNGRVAMGFVILVVAGILTTVEGSLSAPAPQAGRRAINLPGKSVQAPFSDAILSGNTLYLAGRIGLDPKT